MDGIQQKVKVDSELKFQRLYQLQIKAQEKERLRFMEQYESQIRIKEDQLVKVQEQHLKHQFKREEQIKECNDELKKLFEVYSKQDQIISGLQRGDFSGGKNKVHIPQKDLIPKPPQEKFTQLYKILANEDGKIFKKNQNLKSINQTKIKQDILTQRFNSLQETWGVQTSDRQNMQNTIQQLQQQTLQGTQTTKQLDTIPHLTENYQLYVTSFRNYCMKQTLSCNNLEYICQIPAFMMKSGYETDNLMRQNITDMDYEDLKILATRLQQEIKKIKSKPLNPDNIRLEKIQELQNERERLKDMYMAESIKNREFQSRVGTAQQQSNLIIWTTGGGGAAINQMMTNNYLNFGMSRGGTATTVNHNQSMRPMTTVSQNSTIRGGAGGFFVTQMNQSSRPGSKIAGSGNAPRRKIVIKQ